MDYEYMYYCLFNAVTAAIEQFERPGEREKNLAAAELLKCAQRRTEELFCAQFPHGIIRPEKQLVHASAAHAYKRKKP
ncbi:MAG: hypothetical protein PUC05_09230 [Firmicutes bacterium]|nr:hypothetical protein [Bacillota bacterium]